MKISIIIYFLFVPLLLSAQNLEKNFIDQNYIELIGKSEMEVIPNIISLKIVLNEEDTKGKISLSELEAKMIEKLIEIGVDIEKDLVVKDLASNFKYHLFLKSDVVLTKEYILTVDNAKNAANVFLELQKLDISNLSIYKLDHSEIEDYRNKVKSAAIIAARDKAQLLSNAINQNIGRALYIEEFRPGFSPRAMSNVALREEDYAFFYSGSPSSGLPDIEFEAIKLEYSVLVRFELI